MVAAWSNKYSLDESGFELFEDGFNFGEHFYEFNQIKSITTVRILHGHKILFVGTDYDHSVGISIHIDNGDELKLQEKPTWTSDSNLNNVKKIEEIISFLSAKTLRQRLKKYTDQIDKNKQFEYNGWIFNVSSKSFKCIKSNKVYNLNDSIISKFPLFIELKYKSENKVISVLKRTTENLLGGSKYDAFGIILDSDVILILLKHYFALEWKNVPYDQIYHSIP